MHPLLRKLAGGDLRSTGRSDDVARRVLADPTLAGALVAGMNEADPVIRMRSADAFEKVTARKPQLAQTYAEQLLDLLSRPQPKEILWHLLQMAPRVTWSPRQLRVVHAAIERSHLEPSSIVKACALQAEVELLPQSPARESRVRRLIEQALASPVSAVSARARKVATVLKTPNSSSSGRATSAVASPMHVTARRSTQRYAVKTRS